MRLTEALPSFLKLPNRFAALAWTALALVGLAPVLVMLVDPGWTMSLHALYVRTNGVFDNIVAYVLFATPLLRAVNAVGVLALVMAASHAMAWAFDRLGAGLAWAGLSRGDARAGLTGLAVLAATGTVWAMVLVDTANSSDGFRQGIEAAARPLWPHLDDVLRRDAPPAGWPMPAGDPLPTLQALVAFPNVLDAYYVSPTGQLVLLRRGRAPERVDLATWSPRRLPQRLNSNDPPREQVRVDVHDRYIDRLAFGARALAPYRWAYQGFRLRTDLGPMVGYEAGNPVLEETDRAGARLGFVLDRQRVRLALGKLLDQADIPGDGLVAPGEASVAPLDTVLVERHGPEERDWRRVAIAVHDYDRLYAMERQLRRTRVGLALLASLLAVALIELARQVRGLWAERTLALAQSNFVSGVSHEMRTPLATIKLYAELLQDGVAEDAATRKELLGTIGAECDRLGRLIENVLDFAKMSGRRQRYAFGPQDAAALVEEAVAAVRGPLAASGLVLERHVPEGLSFHADRDAVVQALVNLLANAIKYAPAGGCILLACAPSGPDHVEFLVRDFGPGIPEAERRNVFRPFYRVGNELTRTATGSGLGLALVDGHVKSHGGRVDLEDTPGGGATFRVVLPKEPPKRKGAGL
jgi:two-component system phosphate regulon sensor histidine kinase PhoR